MRAAYVGVWKQRLLGVKGGHGDEVSGGDGNFQLVMNISIYKI